MNQVLIIPGIGDRTDFLIWLTRHWPKRYGLQPTVYPFGWGEPIDTYDQKQTAILKKVDDLSSQGRLAIIGISAGGSKAVSLLAERPGQIDCAINICGRLQVAGWSKHLRKYPVFKRSIEIFEQQTVDASKILTFRPLYDEVVPVKTVPVSGAINKRLLTVGHPFTIVWTMATKQRIITNFINQNIKLTDK